MTHLTVMPGVELEPTLRLELERAVASQTTLEHVLAWAHARRPAAVLVDVVVQDEYTHDVVFDLQRGDRLHLVYDTT